MPIILCFEIDKLSIMKKKRWKRLKNKLKAVPVTVVYNYSSITLTEKMMKVLNHGLNFCGTPQSINVTEIMADLKTFERKFKWFEYWSDEREATQVDRP